MMQLKLFRQTEHMHPSFGFHLLSEKAITTICIKLDTNFWYHEEYLQNSENKAEKVNICM